MKQAILKKLLLSGTAALGVIGLSSPAAFAWSGNGGYGSYGSSGYRSMSYTTTTSYSSYSSYNNYHNNDHCYKMNDWSNDWGNKYGGCNMYGDYRHDNGCNRYGGSDSYGKSYW